MTQGDQPKIKIKIRTDFFREKYDTLVDIKRRFDNWKPKDSNCKYICIVYNWLPENVR